MAVIPIGTTLINVMGESFLILKHKNRVYVLIGYLDYDYILDLKSRLNSNVRFNKCDLDRKLMCVSDNEIHRYTIDKTKEKLFYKDVWSLYKTYESLREQYFSKIVKKYKYRHVIQKSRILGTGAGDRKNDEQFFEYEVKSMFHRMKKIGCY